MHQRLSADDAWPGITLWLCALAELPSPSCLACLDADETARAARFVHGVHRRRYLAAHVALRERLAEATGLAPAALRIAADAHGKPRLEGGPALEFNLSHSEDWMLLALGRGTPVGVDIEARRAFDDAAALARRHYSAAERAAVDGAADAPARDAAFLRVWTRKEACMKAVGLGLRIAPSSFEVGAGEAPAVAALRVGADRVAVEVVSLPVGPALVAAVARVRG